MARYRSPSLSLSLSFSLSLYFSLFSFFFLDHRADFIVSERTIIASRYSQPAISFQRMPEITNVPPFPHFPDRPVGGALRAAPCTHRGY